MTGGGRVFPYIICTPSRASSLIADCPPSASLPMVKTHGYGFSLCCRGCSICIPAPEPIITQGKRGVYITSIVSCGVSTSCDVSLCIGSFLPGSTMMCRGLQSPLRETLGQGAKWHFTEMHYNGESSHEHTTLHWAGEKKEKIMCTIRIRTSRGNTHRDIHCKLAW